MLQGKGPSLVGAAGKYSVRLKRSPERDEAVMDFPVCNKCHRKAWRLEEHRVRDDGYVDLYNCTTCNSPTAVMSWGYSNRHNSEGPLQGEGLV